MKGWNPFGKVDMEIGSFIKSSPFNKEYGWGKQEEAERTEKVNRKGK